MQSWDLCGKHRQKIKEHLKTSYCKDLISKYSPDYPVWVLCELVSFGELCKLVRHYDTLYPKRLSFPTSLLFPVRDLRNAAAHNNCLIHDVRAAHYSISGRNNRVNPFLQKEIQQIQGISKRTRHTYLVNKPIHDFLCLLLLYANVVQSEHLRAARCNALNQLINHRCRKNRSYYTQQATLRSAYVFLRKSFYHFRKMY